ncbi:hypothetical protein [Nocardia sp. NBC_01009]|uniref:hypothetical protein n=1 Tax=unclassified Nocardia TaxID=2637762 RepID=UPI00386F1138|nr:hypothetical protein OHA42_01780 [Nocardia sp. NBC_01009]
MEQLPLLPAVESSDGSAARGSPSSLAARMIAQEELLERLLTPGELDMVRKHRV